MAGQDGDGVGVTAWHWSESNVRRYPKGTPISGPVGGGRFAPKSPGSAVPTPQASVVEDVTEAQHRLTEEFAYARGMTVEEYLDTTSGWLRGQIADEEVRIRVPLEAVQGIIDSGGFRARTADELGWDRGQMEEFYFGSDENPIYGYVSGIPEDAGHPVAGYGDVVFRLKPEVAARSTVTVGDSANILVDAGRPSAEVAIVPFVRPSHLAIDFRMTGDPLDRTLRDYSGIYAEVQVWGGVRLEDVEEVVFTNGSSPTPEIAQGFDSVGVRWSVTKTSDPVPLGPSWYPAPGDSFTHRSWQDAGVPSRITVTGIDQEWGGVTWRLDRDTEDRWSSIRSFLHETGRDVSALASAAWDESRVKRYPRGTPVSGREGGGRFAPNRLARFDPEFPGGDFHLEQEWVDATTEAVGAPYDDGAGLWRDESGFLGTEDVKRRVKAAAARRVAAELAATLSPEQMAEVGEWYLALDPHGDWQSEFEPGGGMFIDREVTPLEQSVALTIDNWAATSSDHDPTAIALQEAARQEFGLGDAHGYIEARVSSLEDDPNVGGWWRRMESAIPGARHILRAQYNLTQRLLEGWGVEQAVLFRGLALPDQVTDQWDDVYGVHPVQTNPISSFTHDHATARLFANAKDPDTYPAMIGAVVPRERILSSPFTGFGCLNEHEFTVLGGDDQAFVVHRPPPDFPEIPNDRDPHHGLDNAWTYLSHEDMFWEAWERASDEGPGPVVAAAWDESKHPRHPEGSERGGQFVRKGGETPVEGDPGGLARWEELNAEQQEQKKYYEEFWEQGRAEGLGENDFGSDYWRMWADEQGLELDGNLPADWMQGWTWGEDGSNVDAVIAEAPGISGDIAVWRGAPGGDSGQSDRPLSTSFSKYSALSYADRTGRGDEKDLYRVIIPAGTRVGWDPAEAEVVLPSGTELVEVGPNVRLAKVPPRYVEEWALQSAAWDESKHPRHGAGRREGGRFAPKHRVSVGATPFREGDEASGFRESERWASFLEHVRSSARARGVTVDRIEDVDGYWEGAREPSAAISAHDGPVETAAWAEEVRRAWEQEAVLEFTFDPEGADVEATFEVAREVGAAALERLGVQGATLYPGRMVLYLSPEEYDVADRLAEELGVRPGLAFGKRMVYG